MASFTDPSSNCSSSNDKSAEHMENCEANKSSSHPLQSSLTMQTASSVKEGSGIKGMSQIAEVQRFLGMNDKENPKSKSAFLDHIEKQSVSLSAAAVLRAKRLATMPWTQGNRFQMFVALAIFVNAITLGLEPDYGEELSEVFFFLEHCFTSVFLVEFILRIRVEGPRAYFSEWASCLDFMLMVLSVVDVWIISPMGSQVDLRTLSLLRLLRLLRLARLLRLFRIFRELMIIVQGFLASGKLLLWAAVFLFIIIYIFAILATIQFGRATSCDSSLSRRLSEVPVVNFFSMRALEQVADDEGQCTLASSPLYDNFNEEEIGNQETLFGTVAHSMLTLSMCVLGGCGFEVIRPMTLKTPWVSAYWNFFAFITSFGVINVIVGLFVENVMASAMAAEKDLQIGRERAHRKIINQLQELFHHLDRDQDQMLSRSEWIEAMKENEFVCKCLADIGLEEDEALFDTLDINRGGVLSFEEFFEGMILLTKGNEQAKAKDMVATFLTAQATKQMLRSESEIVGPFKVLARNIETTAQSVAKVEGSLNDRMEAIGKGLDGRIDSLHSKFDNLSRQLDLLLPGRSFSRNSEADDKRLAL